MIGKHCLHPPPTHTHLPYSLFSPFRHHQSVQIYLAVTSMSMLSQQGALRVPKIRQAFGYPSGWPLPQSVIDERFAKAAASGTKSQFTEGLAVMKPLFRFFSGLAKGKADLQEFRGEPQQSYLGFFGLRDPGAPLPPPLKKQ